MLMKRFWIGGFAFAVTLAAISAQGAQDKKDDDKKKDEKVVVKGSAVAAEAELPGDSNTDGSGTVGGQAVAYKAGGGGLTGGAAEGAVGLVGLGGEGVA